MYGIEKLPFQDDDGMWWCYRSDTKALDAGALPLGPFLSNDYAWHQTRHAQASGAPLKLFGRSPKMSLDHMKGQQL